VKRILNNWFVKWVLAPVAVLWALGWGYIQINHPTCTFRYKLTAEVMTPEGLKSGSSVLEVSYQMSNGWLPDSRGKHIDSLRGEAVYVDMGNGRNIFVTLGTLDSNRPSPGWFHTNPFREPGEYDLMVGSLDPIWLPVKVFRLGRAEGKELEMCKRIYKFNGSQQTPINSNNLPTLVTFSDLHQPDTALVVNPNNLVTNFGVGHSIVAKIEISNEPVTLKIDRILPWLQDQSTGKDLRPLNRLSWWEFYKFDQWAEHTYILQQKIF
jgi:hypothetical protein